MKKQLFLALVVIGMVSGAAAAPLDVEVKKLFGSTVSDQAEVTSAEMGEFKEEQGLLAIGTGGDGVIEPGEQVTGTMTVTVNCGGTADICYSDYWLSYVEFDLDEPTFFADGNTYYFTDGETKTVEIDLTAPDSQGTYKVSWYYGNENNVDAGTKIMEDTITVEEVESSTEPEPTDSDGDGVLDSNDACPNTAGDGSDGCPLPEPDIKELDGQVEVQKSNQDEVLTKVDLVNTGDGDMTETHIIEMQVNRQGTGILSFLSFTDYDDQVCDPDNDQAVYEEFRLDAGDQSQKVLTVPIENLEEGLTYDVWLVTRDKCYYDDPVGNEPVEPFGTGFKAGTYTVESTDTEPVDRDKDGVMNEFDECPDTAGPESNNGCPVEDGGVPLLPIVAGVLMVAGAGVYYRYG